MERRVWQWIDLSFSLQEMGNQTHKCPDVQKAVGSLIWLRIDDIFSTEKYMVSQEQDQHILNIEFLMKLFFLSSF